MNQIKKASEFFSSRRSVSVRNLKYPGPSEKQIMDILKSAFRVPDHGKLEPWRIVLITEDNKKSYISMIEKRGKEVGIDSHKVEKSIVNLSKTPLIVTVICSPINDTKIPEIEQILSCGALCLNILNNFLANGWGANWLTGWTAHDPEFRGKVLGLSEHESVAGYIHIGTNIKLLEDRDRPDLNDIVAYL